ncbi:MAG: 1,4-beta-xylanase [Cyclobacteriaceae bacterium]|nr:1,4-beta-xylanase [Cyclobacteriaceae bacterium]
MMRSFMILVLGMAMHNALSQTIWTPSQANDWYQRQPWRIGCNFIPSTAINELEMWQEESFDPVTIDRELGWAQSLGFNTVRVYLHNLPWESDAIGFKRRINQFLEIADKHQILSLFVLFDDCWNDSPRPGKQPAPRPGVHNSGWVQAPGKSRVLEPDTWGSLEKYVKDILFTFKDDKRIWMWDLYNEPGNSGLEEKSLPLLTRVFEWAWSVRPSQPLTCATWTSDKAFLRLNDFQLRSSDVISFHNYNDATSLETEILQLKQSGKPVVCTEYMARTNGSRFVTHLPIFRQHQVGAINWGLVSGKTNTIFPWGSKPGSPEPAVWFHDIFRKDGSPVDSSEVRFIRSLVVK